MADEMNKSRNAILICALAILIIACAPAPSNPASASANLINAQAQATISSQSATQVAADANARLQQQYQRATEQAQQIYAAQQAQLNATQQAQQDAINIAMVEQARTNATASAQQQQAAVSSAWLQVTAQAQQIAATRIPFEATATKIAKDLQNAPTIADFDAILTEAIKLFAVVFIFLVGIVAIRKWQAKDSIHQPNADGPAFQLKHGGLLGSPSWEVVYDPREILQLEAPEQAVSEMPAAPPINDAEIAVMFSVQKWIMASINFKRYLDVMGTFHNDKHTHGWDGHQLLTARECIAAGIFTRNGGKDEAGGRDESVKWLQEKHLTYTANGNSAMYTFGTLGEVSLAIAQALAPYSPAAAIIDQNDAGTAREQGTAGNSREQPGTAGNSAENSGNRPKAVPSMNPVHLEAAIQGLQEYLKK